MLTQIQNLNKQVQLSVEINTLMDQSLKLMEIVNENQKRVNDIKEEQEQLQLHIDNATDQIEA
jgi:gas vesicle protein|tara:strand:- start:110 stop:298 length:189 start_codon:yes stop_codon:yes gene_type:complete